MMTSPGLLHNENDKTWIIRLNRYERDNLLLLLNIIGYGDKGLSPFNRLNNGDWVGQIALKLERRDGSITIDEEDHPNTSYEQIKDATKQYGAAIRLHSSLMAAVAEFLRTTHVALKSDE